LIDENLPRSIRFYESDFNRSLESWKGHWIIIQIEFSELDVSEEAQAIAMHKVGEMDEFDTTKGTYSLIYRPRENKRRELFECSEDLFSTQIELEAILDSITLNDYELSYRGRGNVDFSIEENYLRYVGDFEKIVFPNPDDQQEDIYGSRLQGFSIPNELSCTFIKALRDVEADLRARLLEDGVRLIKAGYSVISNLSESLGIPHNILVTRTEVLEKYSEMSKRVLKAYIQGMQLAKFNKRFKDFGLKS
jgi:hypothetical protein